MLCGCYIIRVKWILIIVSREKNFLPPWQQQRRQLLVITQLDIAVRSLFFFFFARSLIMLSVHIHEFREVTKSYPSSSSGMLFPLYRVDYYAARAKAGKTIPETGYYAVDDSGSTYIKAAPVYSAPEKLGTYEINHRKATVRKPSKSDYQAPESLLRQDN